MDIRLILAVVITVVLLGALWFVLQRRKRQAAEQTRGKRANKRASI